MSWTTSHSDADTFQAFLGEASEMISFSRKRNVLIMDNASWHKKKTIDFYNFKPMFLPPYSQDLNPIEQIWDTIKARWFNNHVCRKIQQLIDGLDTAILDVIDNPMRTRKTTSIGKLF
ncbi:MAG: transposase [Desulfobacter sp.]|nr:MAG: transposase [Desulfobacter sp.]